jgi:hypothetical protein
VHCRHLSADTASPERVRKRTKFSVMATNTVTAAKNSRLAR